MYNKLSIKFVDWSDNSVISGHITNLIDVGPTKKKRKCLEWPSTSLEFKFRINQSVEWNVFFFSFRRIPLTFSSVSTHFCVLKVDSATQSERERSRSKDCVEVEENWSVPYAVFESLHCILAFCSCWDCRDYGCCSCCEYCCYWRSETILIRALCFVFFFFDIHSKSLQRKKKRYEQWNRSWARLSSKTYATHVFQMNYCAIFNVC